jgi:ribose/xylose/arabinose/galactoside ABC-type transport system permease subunit
LTRLLRMISFKCFNELAGRTFPPIPIAKKTADHDPWHKHCANTGRISNNRNFQIARFSRTAFGISAYMIGSNLEATRYSGIDTKRVLVKVYVLSSMLCWFAACLMMARFNSASPAYAQSYLLITILAAVLGGVDPFGCFGRILGLLMALAVLQVISFGFNLLGLNQYLTLAIWGGTLISIMGFRCFVAPWIAARRPSPTKA